jgi:hypothetical protein
VVDARPTALRICRILRARIYPELQHEPFAGVLLSQIQALNTQQRQGECGYSVPMSVGLFSPEKLRHLGEVVFVILWCAVLSLIRVKS